MRIISNIDLGQNELQNAAIQRLATAPGNPVKGQIYFNSVHNRLFYYNGSEWVGADAIGAAMTGDNIITAINASSSLIDDDNLSAEVQDAISKRHSTTHTISQVTGLQTALDGKVDDSQVMTNVPAGAVFTDTVTSINDKTGVIAKADIVALGIPAQDTVYTHPTTAGNKHIPTGGASGQILRYSASGTAVWGADNDTVTTINGKTGAIAKSDIVALGIPAQDTVYTHPATHSISEVSGLQTALDDKVDDSQVLTNVPLNAKFTDTVYTHPATHSADMITDGTTNKAYTATEKTKLSGIATNANNYSHPTSDGSKHVPATGTTNNGKVLTAGSTAGSTSWATPTVTWANVSSKPTSTTSAIDTAVTDSHTHSNKTLLDTYTQTNANLADAVGKKHTQNTDTKTSSNTFQIGNTGVVLKNSTGTALELRNSGDTDYADLRVANLTVEGTTTTINSNEVSIGDNEIVLNSEITDSLANSDGGIVIKRLMADNTTRKDAKLTFDNSSGRWETVGGDVTGTLVTAQIANKVSATVGNGVATSFIIPHNFNTRDLVVMIRETSSPYAQVITDVEMTTVNSITVFFASAPASNAYTITIVG